MSRASKAREEEALQHASVLQNSGESLEARLAASDALLCLSRHEHSCASLCAVGGIHALVAALKAAPDAAPLVLRAAQALSNLYRFDPKLTSVVLRLQDGIAALLAAAREHLHSADAELLGALLAALADVCSTAANVAPLVKHGGHAVLLGALLAHLKHEPLLLLSLQALIHTSRHAAHVPSLAREGAVPALLAALLSHLRRAEVLRLALLVLRNLVADEACALRMAGQGAYRVVFAVLQCHGGAEQLELVRLGAAVLWRMHHARHPPAPLLHAQLSFSHAPLAESAEAAEALAPRGEGGSSSSDDEAALTPRGATAGGREGGVEAVVAPTAAFTLGGHAPFIDAVPPQPEGLLSTATASAHSELIVKALIRIAERLLVPSPLAASPDGCPLPPPSPRIVYDAYPPDNGSAHAGAASDSLLFDSKFECGNLRRAVQISPTEYDLVLSCDVNTRGHTQWFLFRVKNMRPGVPYRFNIINMMKPDSLFSSGMRPLLYSEADALKRGVGWVRAGAEVCYYQNQYSYAGSAKKKKKDSAPPRDTPMPFYTLSMAITFPYAHDTVFIAQCYPYSYSKLQQYLAALVAERGELVRRETLCLSSGRNTCELLTVTDFNCDEKELASRKVAVISARVHPGESNASWMMEGFIDAITSDSSDAIQLRQQLVVKIIPMLNPDGVILGNYRCGLSGVDLNRQWNDPSEARMPTIFHTKKLLKALAASEQLLLFCDLHGHSRKRNIFMYGCENLRGPLRLRERVFPRLLADYCPYFSLSNCSFKVLRSKENTGRVVVCRQLGLPSSFTLEASFCGADFGQGSGVHFNTSHLKEMGAVFVIALLDMVDPNQTRVHSIMADLEAAFPPPQDADDDDEADGAAERSERDGNEAAARRPARGRRAAPPKASSSVSSRRKSSVSPQEAPPKAAAKKKASQPA